MAELQRLVNALRNADKAGNIEDARLLARELRRVQQGMVPGGFPAGGRGQSFMPLPDRPGLGAIAASGLIDAATIVPELVAAADRKLFGMKIPRPLAGRQRARDLAESVGIPLAPPFFKPEGSAEELTTGAALGLGMIPSLKVASKMAGGRLGQFLDPTAGRPVRGAAVLAGSGATAEVGASAARESAEESGQNEQAAEIVGALFFGAFPSVAGPLALSAARGVLKGSAAVLKRVPGTVGQVTKVAEKGVLRIEEEVRARIETGAGKTKAAGRIRELSGDPQRDADLITPGGGEFGQPPAVETGNVRLMRLFQDILETDNGLSDFHAAATRQRATQLKEAITAPAEGATAVEAQTFIRQQRVLAEEMISLRLEQAKAVTAQRVAALEPSMMETASSRIAKEEVQSALDSVRNLERELWGRVDPKLTGATFEAFKAFNVAKGELTSSTLDDMPAVATARLGRRGIGGNKPPPGMEISGEAPSAAPKGFGKQETVKEMRGLMRKLREVARKARSDNDGGLARMADNIADGVLEDLENIKGVDPALGFARAYTRDVRSRFKKGPIGRILKTTSVGGEAVSAEETLQNVIGGTGAKAKVGVDELFAAIDAGAAARKAQGLPALQDRGREAVEDFLKLRFANFTTPRGEFKPGKALDFLEKNTELLDAFPDIKLAMRKAAESGVLDADMQALAKAGLREARDSPGGKFANAAFEQEFKSILAAGDPKAVGQAARTLARTTASDETGRAALGLKASLFNHLLDAGASSGELSGKAMLEAFTDPRVQAIAREFLSPDEKIRLGRLIKIITNEELMRGKLPSIGGVFDDTPNRILDIIVAMFSAESGTRLSKLVGRGNLVLPQKMSSQGRRTLQSLTVDKAREALGKAVIDGKFMKAILLPFDTPGNIKKIERVFGPFLAAQTGRISGEIQREDSSLPPLTQRILDVSVSQGRNIAPVVLARSFVGKGQKKEAAVIGAFTRQMVGKTVEPGKVQEVSTLINSILNGGDFAEFGTETKKPRIGDVAVFRDGTVGFFRNEVRQNGQSFVRIIAGNPVSERLIPKDQLLNYRRPSR